MERKGKERRKIIGKEKVKELEAKGGQGKEKKRKMT